MGIRAHNPTVWPVADHSYPEGERGKRGRERVYLGSGIAGQKEEEQTKKVRKNCPEIFHPRKRNRSQYLLLYGDFPKHRTRNGTQSLLVYLDFPALLTDSKL